jgi:glycosyltransferase involved in cell wall biosynthesis
MIVGIDGNEANIEKRVGVNQYAYEILSGIAKLQDEWKNKHRFIVYLREKPLPDLPKETKFFRYKVLPGRSLWIITKLTPALLLNKEKLDIFFSPSHYIPPFSPIPTVCSIMDLGYLEFSEQFRKYDYWQLRIWSAYSIFASKYVIAISNSTKSDIVRHYPSASNKIKITHLAYDKDKFNSDISPEDVRRIKNKYAIVDDYILYLGTLKPSKNIEGILEAYASIYKDLKLVIAGKKGWLFEPIFEKVKKLGLEKRVIFTDFVPEEDKPPLMAGAKVFCLPSFWEGFGLDVLNAMACGVPVVVSKVGSLPEVAGQAGIYVDSKEPKSIAEGLKRVLSMSDLEYNKLREKGLAQAKKFSWEKTTRKTLKILEEIKK